MAYKVLILASAENSILKLSKKEQLRIVNLLSTLSDNPRPHGCKKLKGSKDFYRIKSGNNRIIYTIEDDILTVTIVKAGKRSEIYLKLKKI
jgi:mRNA interferase RelE/StbE